MATPPALFGKSHTSPDELYGPLFTEVQSRRIFKDSKSFADAVPRIDPAGIMEAYMHQKEHSDFNLKAFVTGYFEMPHIVTTETDTREDIPPIIERIDWLWSRLSRPVKAQHQGGSLLMLPEPYVVPGGRFREIYYWDSYFTMLGLRESGRVDLIESMLQNFVYLIDHFGHIPTGNRTYYLSRSQPPFFSLMVGLYAEIKGREAAVRYLPQLQREYDYWMEGSDRLDESTIAHRRVVRLPDGTLLNRYWDDRALPRPEAYCEDVELAKEAQQNHGHEPESVYRCLRAAAESGWDFSSRWMVDGKTFATIHTTNILPVDLNCLIQHLESTLAETYRLNAQPELGHYYEAKARERCQAINAWFWNSRQQFYMDYDFRQQKTTGIFSLAGIFPLYFKLANLRQARFVDAYVRLNFLRSGGVVTTLNDSGQQWDAPNGWAPLQWITYQGLRNYQFNCSASRLRANWLHLVEKQYSTTGKMLEKYNILNTNLLARDGEYDLQEGFGWTNGVYLIMKNQKAC
ncbi:alpha,alpha-trehalase TreF [Cytophagaceae bacterium SJW1-29]|uniref:Alpha,alpha-trehalase TreF n=1 Tax=Salmonirosea aquatica TaxID=2654236 RepID=A0A7C9FEI6_9BACT|nr:alpha,alpha-trehalase TreF [Cytophagaceae bacterium SJW1-29]